MKLNLTKKSGLLSAALLFAFNVIAQFTVSPTISPADLASRLVGSGVTISGAFMNCPPGASGTFLAGPSPNEVGFGAGIMLTSGQISKAESADDEEGAGQDNGWPNANDDAALEALAGFETFDPCVLEFDLEATGNKVTFRYVFASEEYDEYFCQIYNDVFAFFVSGPKPGGGSYTNENIALVPGTTTPVSINNVGHTNCGTVDNRALYINNSGATTLQYDGKTVVLTATVDLIPCRKYHFKLGVTDSGDGVWDSGVFIEAGSFKSSPPVVNCPAPLTVNNDPGICGAKVVFNPTATSDCPVVTSCSPASGGVFPLGNTAVTCTATDVLGNQGFCGFTVTVKDNEKPSIVCPANVTVSCEASTTPSAVGFPVVADNCGTLPPTFADVKVPGSCTHDFTINRTWTVKDPAGNANNCLQKIKVEDKKAPVINCPPNITVTCDTSVAKTGKAVATDNCDMDVTITWSNTHILGDCEWFCITNRTWTATDDCGNKSQCVQIITKDVTPLIEKALEAGPLVWGQTAATVTLPPGRGACVVQWLPYSGTVPKALKFDDAVADGSCRLMSNPIDGTGHIVNPLLGEALKLKILVRLNPALGTRKVKDILVANGCPAMHFIVRQNLGGGEEATVNELLRVTDLTLGNVNVSLLVPAHCLELLKVLKCMNMNRDVCKNP